MALIEAKHLAKIYRDEADETVALRNISLEIKEGEFVAIMGPSGSGKSTLLHLLGFLDNQTSGEYRFAGKTAADFTEEEIAHVRNSQMGFVFQAFNLLPRTTVRENVRLPLLYSRVPESHWRQKVEEAVALVGLTHRINYLSSQLSGGEKQRAAIARALVNSPAVVFADEPTGNLDSKSGGQIMDFLQQLHNKGHTIVLITHETYTAEYAERIIKLHDGSLQSDARSHQRRLGGNHFTK